MTQQVANQKYRIVSEAIGQFLNSFGHFAIFEVAEAAIELANLLPRVLHEMTNLFRREADAPQHAPISLGGESLIEYNKTLRIFELLEPLLRTRLDEIHRLRENLHQRSGPTSLFRERRRITIDVFEAILVMLRRKLANRSVIQHSAAGEQVVAVPRKPVENVFLFEHRRELRIRTREIVEGSGVTQLRILRHLPDAVFDFAPDKIIDRCFQLRVFSLLQITKHVRRANQIRRAADADRGSVCISNDRETALRRNTLTIKDLGHHGAAEHLV